MIDGVTCNATFISGCAQTPPSVGVGREQLGYDAVDPGRHLLYASNSLDDTVSVIDTASCRATVTSGCGQAAPTVAINAGGAEIGLSRDGTPYVAGNANGPVSFFRFEVPAKPTSVSATTSHGHVKLRWKAVRDGRLPIIYHVTPEPACPSCTGLTTPSTSGQPLTAVSGLTPGTAYTFTVRGIDAAGTGPPSAPLEPDRAPLTALYP